MSFKGTLNSSPDTRFGLLPPKSLTRACFITITSDPKTRGLFLERFLLRGSFGGFLGVPLRGSFRGFFWEDSFKGALIEGSFKGALFEGLL